ncbi:MULTISPECIES: hypothetical protein [unclassified Rhizobium]|uniref:hypothetical protein n=1 Tax=unclassified Rhizobium TaxID=2613769 RepID=UPI001ADB6F7C|nr:MULTISPECIES: hypothetical protein [unclassified Rhizobium]MBO9126921.1 hypothetical protein [Rhizobium sp. 16-488-2b]MBO9177369.1 hypothetical protein [Rhizobium sp. 16-488-2a]
MKMFDITEVDTFKPDILDILEYAAKISDVADVCLDRGPSAADTCNQKLDEAINVHNAAAKTEKIVGTVSGAPAR